MKEYRRCLSRITKAELNAKNKVKAINAYVLPLLIYSSGIIHYNNTELEHFNSRTRLISTQFP